MSHLNVLSLDLDWFNRYEYATASSIDSFFARLSGYSIPRTIGYFTDHHYMYPWCLELLKQSGYKRVNVVNIDEHHDFYYLDELKFSTPCRDDQTITCGNFFAFMAHESVLWNYDWVSPSRRNTVHMDECDLFEDLAKAQCPKVRRQANRCKVWSASEVWMALEDKYFDGFAIIRSPDYTCRYKRVCRATENALANWFPQAKVKRNSCRSDFQYHHRRNIRVTA